jgi:nucleoside-diphosphate-sugar epimerase
LIAVRRARHPIAARADGFGLRRTSMSTRTLARDKAESGPADKRDGGQSARALVLVTGATGAIGSRVAKALSASYDVVGLDLNCSDASYECRGVDLTSSESIARALGDIEAAHGARIASVIHLAAYYDLRGEPNPLYDAVNVEGTRRLLRALQAFEVQQFLYASTMLVHAPTSPGVPIDESSPLAAEWAYPQSKLAAEEVVRQEHGRIPFVLLRIAGM